MRTERPAFLWSTPLVLDTIVQEANTQLSTTGRLDGIRLGCATSDGDSYAPLCSRRLVVLGVKMLGPHVDPVLVPAGEGDGADDAGDGQRQVAAFNVLDNILPLSRPS